MSSQYLGAFLSYSDQLSGKLVLCPRINKALAGPLPQTVRIFHRPLTGNLGWKGFVPVDGGNLIPLALGIGNAPPHSLTCGSRTHLFGKASVGVLDLGVFVLGRKGNLILRSLVR